MKKSNKILAICVMWGSIGSALALLVIYGYSPSCLFEDFLGSVFTGCLFAIPSGLLIICEDIKRVSNEQASILAELDVCFTSVDKREFDERCFEKIEKNRVKVVKLYKSLGRELAENYINRKAREKIEQLINTIYAFSSCILDLKREYVHIDEKEFDDSVKKILELKDSCTKIIQEIQEKRYKDGGNCS